MTIVDLTKARAYADSGFTGPAAAEWIHELADEVESLEKLVAATRVTSQAALAEAAALATENRTLRKGLADICDSLARLIEGQP